MLVRQRADEPTPTVDARAQQVNQDVATELDDSACTIIIPSFTPYWTDE